MQTDIPIFPARPARPSLEIFLNSLWAFLLREVRDRYASTRLGIFWGLLDPVATIGFLLAMHFVIRGGTAPIYGAHPLMFFVWGVGPFFMLQHSIKACTGVCNSSRGLFNYRQIRPIDIMIARSLLETMELGIALALFLAAFAWFGIPLEAERPDEIVALLLVIVLTGLAIGVTFEVYATTYPDLRRVFSFVMRPMLFISGLFFTIGSLSPAVRPYFLWNPLLHLIDLLHGATLRGYDSPASLTYVLLFDGVMLVVALSAYRRHMHQLV